MQTYQDNNTLLGMAHSSATTIINGFIGSLGLLCSVPMIRVSSDRVVVQLFYFAVPTPGQSVFTPLGKPTAVALNALGAVLSRLYPGLTLELRFVRLQYPYLNASILAQYLAINAAKYGFNRLHNTLVNAVPFVKIDSVNSEVGQLPSHISGVKIELAGLLTTQRAAPRKTVYSASAGTFQGTVDYSHSTAKSDVGSYTVKVWLSTTT